MLWTGLWPLIQLLPQARVVGIFEQLRNACSRSGRINRPSPLAKPDALSDDREIYLPQLWIEDRKTGGENHADLYAHLKALAEFGNIERFIIKANGSSKAIHTFIPVCHLVCQISCEETVILFHYNEADYALFWLLDGLLPFMKSLMRTCPISYQVWNLRCADACGRKSKDQYYKTPNASNRKIILLLCWMLFVIFGGELCLNGGICKWQSLECTAKYRPAFREPGAVYRALGGRKNVEMDRGESELMMDDVSREACTCIQARGVPLAACQPF